MYKWQWQDWLLSVLIHVFLHTLCQTGNLHGYRWGVVQVLTTRNQNKISVLDFGFQTFLFPSVSPIKSQNFSELRKTFSSQNTFMKHSPVTTPEGRRGGCRLAALSSKVYSDAWSSVQAQGGKQLAQSWVLAGNLTPHVKTTLTRSTVFFGTRKQKSGSLEIRAAGNGNIPFYFTFLTLLNYKELESWHNNSFFRHDTLKCKWSGVFRGGQRKEGRKKNKSVSSTCCCWWRLLLLNYIYRNLQDKLKSKRF